MISKLRRFLSTFPSQETDSHKINNFLQIELGSRNETGEKIPPTVEQVRECLLTLLDDWRVSRYDELSVSGNLLSINLIKVFEADRWFNNQTSQFHLEREAQARGFTNLQYVQWMQTRYVEFLDKIDRVEAFYISTRSQINDAGTSSELIDVVVDVLNNE